MQSKSSIHSKQSKRQRKDTHTSERGRAERAMEEEEEEEGRGDEKIAEVACARKCR